MTRLSHNRSRSPYISLIPIGFGAWAPIYAGVKARRTAWIALGALWSAMVVVALVLSSGHGHGHANDGIVGALAIIAWVGGIATSISIRGAYEEEMGSPFARAVEALELPGIDGDVATAICECREKLGGFSSLEDLVATLELDGGVVEGLRDRVVFLPRS